MEIFYWTKFGIFLIAIISCFEVSGLKTKNSKPASKKKVSKNASLTISDSFVTRSTETKKPNETIQEKYYKILDMQSNLKPKGRSFKGQHHSSRHHHRKHHKKGHAHVQTGRASEPYRLNSDIMAEVEAISELCSKTDLFLDMKSQHRKGLNKLIKLLRAEKNTEKLLKMAKKLGEHPKLNLKMWLRAILTVTLKRPELVGLDIPSVIKFNPVNFIPFEALSAPELDGQESETCFHLDGRFTEDAGEEEHRLWYFREDLMLNIRHWFWHITYAYDSDEHLDRRGELFGYFHHNSLTRYHAERLANGLGPVIPFFIKEGLVIPEGYNPHLGDMGDPDTAFGARKNNAKLTTDGEKVFVNDSSILNILGLVLEGAIAFNINPSRYLTEGIHNVGHDSIATLSQNGLGVMYSSETAMRDIVFYKWHNVFDEYFFRVSKVLPPYFPKKGDLQLNWPVATIQELKITTASSKDGGKYEHAHLYSFFDNITLSLPYTVSTSHSGAPINYCIKRLNHKPFDYQFLIKSTHMGCRKATIRVFMAPRYDGNGTRFTMQAQRKLFFPMDQFTVTLNEGLTRVHRRSIDSNLVVPSNYDGTPKEFRHCECGWPQHLLLPRGTPEGMAFDLFAMVTDASIDEVEVQIDFPEVPVCISAFMICGKYDHKYPDSRPMGYPFNRRPFTIKDGEETRVVADLDEYIKPNNNMKTIEVTIFHLNGKTGT